MCTVPPNLYYTLMNEASVFKVLCICYLVWTRTKMWCGASLEMAWYSFGTYKLASNIFTSYMEACCYVMFQFSSHIFSFISLRLLPLNQMYLFLMNICYLLLLLQKQCERKISREAKTQCMVNGDATHFQDFCIFFPPPMQNHLNSYTYSMENVWRKNTA